MSHAVQIQTQVRDAEAVRLACRRLHLPEPVNGSVKLFSSTVDGLAVQLPGWNYPVVCRLTADICERSQRVSAAQRRFETFLFLPSRRFLPVSLGQRLTELVQACFTGIWIESYEHDDAIAEIAGLCREQQWQLMAWDVDQGLAVSGAHGSADATTGPLAAIRSLGAVESRADTSCLLVMRNLHRFLQSAEIVQALLRQLATGK